ncbi:MAG TPA: hypothetical protein VG603_01840 [Chitinophagales bacterium]|nr:hypothetical protein [Chitinophagales bacterium]
MFKNIRNYENLHIALWLLKDSCWVMTWRVPGMLMIVPTLFVAIHITYRSRKDIADLFHNIAVCLWISANATWMTGEFFFHDTWRPYASVFFAMGVLTVIIYYTYYLPRKLRLEKAALEESGITE